MKQKNQELKDIAIETKMKHTGKKKEKEKDGKNMIRAQWAVGQSPQLRYMSSMSKKGVER